MKILTIDIGTGTQDIFLFDSQLDIENGFKLIMPSPTMMVFRKIQNATRHGIPLLLNGVTMGGGPSQWAAEAHVRAGLPIYITPDAGRSFNDDLDIIRDMGMMIIGEDEIKYLPETIQRIELRDFYFPAIRNAFRQFGVGLDDLEAMAIAVFDHGNAPDGISDRQFRFDYLNARVQNKNCLSGFAYLSNHIPTMMTRLAAVARSAKEVHTPLVVMDTAPAAILGATFDTKVSQRERVLITNIGNFHTLAFRMGINGIEGVFEHHTGLLNREKLEKYLRALSDGTLTHNDVFKDHGHGALINSSEELDLSENDYGVAVTGPRRNMLAGSALRPHFCAPFGDMMITGCFGLLAAVADLLPETSEIIHAALNAAGKSSIPPWEIQQ